MWPKLIKECGSVLQASTAPSVTKSTFLYSQCTSTLQQSSVMMLINLTAWQCQVFWYVTQCCKASCSWCFNRFYCLHLPDCLILKALLFFKMLITTYPVTLPHPTLQQHCCDNLSSHNTMTWQQIVYYCHSICSFTPLVTTSYVLCCKETCLRICKPIIFIPDYLISLFLGSTDLGTWPNHFLGWYFQVFFWPREASHQCCRYTRSFILRSSPHNTKQVFGLFCFVQKGYNAVKWENLYTCK
jgi:hypothetical protein